MSAIQFDNSYARLPDAFYAKVDPEVAPAPRVIKINTDLALELGLDADWLASDAGLAMLSGATVADGTEPLAMAYAGHQFGGWSHQLGDGRAHLLGEFIGADNVRHDLQLKGSGRTPFSRNGDGKAALGPVLREYIVSEFMAAVGVPTTRALAAVETGARVQRETAQPGAVLARVAQSHVRVGTFQYFYAREWTDKTQILADYVIDRHYPEARKAENPVVAMLEMIVLRQARLIARWMGLGFIHGVMNTDNMQIAGETIDYGPCAFMDAFHPGMVFSSIDQKGRYAWANQPNIGVWNLSRLAETLLPLMDQDEEVAKGLAETAVGAFAPAFNAAMLGGFAAKLGVVDGEGFGEFLNETFKVMADNGVDFTLFFRRLSQVAMGGDEADVLALFADREAGANWLLDWRRRLDSAAIAEMPSFNPIYIPRNHQVERAIASALLGDFSVFERLTKVLETPFAAQADSEGFEAAPLPEEVVQQTFCGT